MRTILAKINILANAFEKDGNLETAELLHDVFIKISKKKKKKSSGKNVPNNPSLWASCQAWAKKTYDTHPSAYSNAGAARRYKQKGGTWRKASVENVRVAQETIDMSLDPQVRDEQRDIKIRNDAEQPKKPIILFEVANDLKDLIFMQNNTDKAAIDKIIKELNAPDDQTAKLQDAALFYIRLKINDPKLTTENFKRSYEALDDITEGNPITARNIGYINNLLRKKLNKGYISNTQYFTALEISRLRSTGAKE
jgi:hypothetical protein